MAKDTIWLQSGRKVPTMPHDQSPSTPRPARRFLLAAVTLAAVTIAAATPAAAWWRGGFWVGVVPPPVYIGPPVVYPPPYYYPPPPPVWYPPPPGYAEGAPPVPPPPAGTGQSCYAGPYVCPMDHPVASGSACYCLANDRSKVWGRAS